MPTPSTCAQDPKERQHPSWKQTHSMVQAHLKVAQMCASSVSLTVVTLRQQVCQWQAQTPLLLGVALLPTAALLYLSSLCVRGLTSSPRPCLI